MASRSQTPREGGDVGLGELLRQLGSDLGTLLQEQIALARKETKEALSALKTATLLVAAGAVLSLLALGTLIAAAVLALGGRMGYDAAALLVGGALTVIAVGAVAFGVHRLRSVPVKPEKTIESLEETKEWMKDLT